MDVCTPQMYCVVTAHRYLTITAPASTNLSTIVSASGEILIKFYALGEGGNAQLDYLAIDVTRAAKRQLSRVDTPSYLLLACCDYLFLTR